MSTRVVATKQAEHAAQEMKRLVHGPMEETLRKLDQLGATLSNPQEWDGRLANQFRTTDWPNVKNTNHQFLKQLELMQERVLKIIDDILAAGGDAPGGGGGRPPL